MKLAGEERSVWKWWYMLKPPIYNHDKRLFIIWPENQLGDVVYLNAQKWFRRIFSILFLVLCPRARTYLSMAFLATETKLNVIYCLLHSSGPFYQLQAVECPKVILIKFRVGLSLGASSLRIWLLSMPSSWMNLYTWQMRTWNWTQSKSDYWK